MSNRVHGYRNMLGLTQKELAKALNITPQSVSAKENGKRSFTDNEKVFLLELFREEDNDLTIDKLFF